jgi:beta-carotene ketolase (CrtO type)
MADASYDVVVVGGGHHATIIACYLQNAGMETAVFERQHELGGGACSEELIAPGFIFDPCATFTRFYNHPAYTDFKLWEKGLNHLFPELSTGIIFDDETYIIAYPLFEVEDELTGKTRFVTENMEKLYKEIAKFSEHDAEVAMILAEKLRNKWLAALRLETFSVPTPWGVKSPVEQLLDDPKYGIDPSYQFMTTLQQACDLFESDEMRLYYLRMSRIATECLPDDVIPLSLFIHNISLALGCRPASVIVGGTHSVTHALQRTFSEMGGKFFVQHEVDKIIIEGGMAKGIRLTDGTEIEARKAVVADVDTNQLIFRLIGEEYVSPEIARKVRNINYDRGQAMWGHFALHELPKYKVSKYNPDCQKIPRLSLMPKDFDYYVYHHPHELYQRGFGQKITLTAISHSQWDSTRAPRGKHTFHIEEISVPLRFFTPRQWLKIGEDFIKESLKALEQYAPNMTPDNVIAMRGETPYEVIQRNVNMLDGSTCQGSLFASQWGRLRPIPELSGYRTPIRNVYLCSASTHPGIGIGRSCSYNCYKVMAEDFGLRKIWEEKGRPY